METTWQNKGDGGNVIWLKM